MDLWNYPHLGGDLDHRVKSLPCLSLLGPWICMTNTFILEATKPADFQYKVQQRRVYIIMWTHTYLLSDCWFLVLTDRCTSARTPLLTSSLVNISHDDRIKVSLYVTGKECRLKSQVSTCARCQIPPLEQDVLETVGGYITVSPGLNPCLMKTVLLIRYSTDSVYPMSCSLLMTHSESCSIWSYCRGDVGEV